MSIAFKNVVVFVTDLAISRKFYADTLGLAVSSENEMMVEFSGGGGASLGIALAVTDDARKLVGRHTGITLKSSDIKALCDKISADNGRFIEPLESSPWGKMAVIADPDGNQIALVDR